MTDVQIQASHLAMCQEAKHRALLLWAAGGFGRKARASASQHEATRKLKGQRADPTKRVALSAEPKASVVSKESLNPRNALAGGLEHPTGQSEPHIPVLLSSISSKSAVRQQRNLS